MASVQAEPEPEPTPLAGFAAPEEHPVTAKLITEHTAIQLGGTTRVGVRFELEDGWHIYAEDPGDAGLPTTIEWTGPADLSFGPLTWPEPHEFLDPGDIATFGYDEPTLLSSAITLRSPADASEPSLRIHAHAEWLACKEICIPGTAELELTLPISLDPPFLSPHAELFER